MYWGLVPKWAKDPRIGYKMINARSETLNEKPSFKGAFKNYRCLIPANGFYEWKKFDNHKVPYYIHEKGGELVSFAGLYSVWVDAERKKLLTYTIVTKKAAENIKGIHHRMPVILDREGEEVWLNKDSSEEMLLDRIGVDIGLDYYQVSNRVGNAGYKDADLLDRV
jgi:putative SOS response-associated peptidase YedK